MRTVVRIVRREIRIEHPDDALSWALFGAVWAFVGAALGFGVLQGLLQ